MNIVNVKKDTYLKAVYNAESRGTAFERERLRFAKYGFFPEKLFKGAPHGHAVSLCTWLMVLRADMRGKLALTKLLEPEYEQKTTPSGHTYKARVWKPSKEAYQKALAEQHALITKLMEEFPEFFAGMIIDEDAPASEPTVVPADVPIKRVSLEKKPVPKPARSMTDSLLRAFKALVGAR